MSANHVRKFVKFHQAHPEVYDLFKRFAFEAINAGMTRISGRFLLYRIRWEVSVVTKGAGWNMHAGKEFKLNDHLSPYYSRLFVIDHPQYRDHFEFRDAS